MGDVFQIAAAPSPQPLQKGQSLPPSPLERGTIRTNKTTRLEWGEVKRVNLRCTHQGSYTVAGADTRLVGNLMRMLERTSMRTGSTPGTGLGK